MAHAFTDLRLRCSYKNATLFLCAGNVLIALYMLRAALAPACLDSSSAPTVSRVIIDGLEDAPSKEELERIEDSNRLRRELLPSTLIERIDEIRQETQEEINKTEALNLEKIKSASELTEKLLELHKNDDELVPSNLIVSDDGLYLSVNELEIDSEDDTIPGRPLPPECHAEAHTDYRGAAVRWGLTHHVDSAADCCQACLDQARNATADQKKCNIWVYCPRKGGCYSPDKYTHENHECWLKQADEPMLNFKGRYGEEYRRQHPTAPVVVPWASGVVS